MYRKYKSQFRKLLNIISNNFLSALRGKGNANLNHIILDIETYLEDRRFLEEPEGKTLVGGSLLSSDAFPEPEHAQEYYRHSSNSYY